jgi:hypothetical protein
MDGHAEPHKLATKNPLLRHLAPVATIVLVIIGAICAFLMATAEPSFERPASQSKRTDASPVQPLNLKSYYHTPASRFVNDRFPWGEVPRGAQTFGNVPLAIDGAMYLWGASNAKNGLVFPEQIEGISVDRKFETMYVYHGAFFTSPDGSPVYRLTMHYADGTSSEHTICYGTHVRDWYETPNSKTKVSDPKSQIVWRGDHPNSTPSRPIKLRFSITSIANPKPSLEVKSISLASAKGNSAGCILAITTGASDLLKPAP